MKEATNAQIVYIIRYHLIKAASNETLKYYTAQIEDYYSNLNGAKLFELSRKEICHQLEGKCENNKKIKGPSMKLLKQLKEFDVNKIPKTIPDNFKTKTPEYKLKVKLLSENMKKANIMFF